MAKPNGKRVSVFGGGGESQPSPTPDFYSMTAANNVYEEGAPSLFPDEIFVSPDTRRAQELEDQLLALQQQIENQGSSLAVSNDGTLSVHDFKLTPTGLIAPDSISPDAWVDMGRLLAKLEGSLQWLIGDWIVYGEAIQWGDIPGLAQELGFAAQTLYDYASVSRKVQFSIRIENLSFAHHRLVMGMSTEYQVYALKFAAHHGYSVADFRKWIKLDMPETGLPKELPSPIQATDAPFAAPKPAIAKLEKISQRDFSTWKKKDKSEVLEYTAKVRAWIDDLEAKAKG